MTSVESIFGRNDFDDDWSQELTAIMQECASTFGEPVAGYAQVLSSMKISAKKQPMSVWFVVADQLVRMQHGKSGGTKWPIKSLHGSMSHGSATKTLTLSQNGGGDMAFAIMALDERHVAYLERFLRFLTERGLDLAE
jgi:hypothetical protein